MIEFTILRAALTEFLRNGDKKPVAGLSSVTVIKYMKILDVDQYDRRREDVSVMDHLIKIRDETVTRQKSGQGITGRVLLHILTHLIHGSKIEDRTDDDKRLFTAVIDSFHGWRAI